MLVSRHQIVIDMIWNEMNNSKQKMHVRDLGRQVPDQTPKTWTGEDRWLSHQTEIRTTSICPLVLNECTHQDSISRIDHD